MNMIGAIIATVIVFLIGGAIVAFCIKMIIVTTKQKKEDKRAGRVRFYSIVHIGGLDAPRNFDCKVYLSHSHLSITSGGKEFLIKLSQITNAENQIDLDEDRYFINGDSSLVAKTGLTASSYALISYESTYGDLSTIVLRDKYDNGAACLKLVKKIKPLINTQIRQVEL